MSEIGDAAVVPLGEVVPLEHARDGHLRGHPEHAVHVERREPLGVAADLEPLGRRVEDAGRLLDVGVRVGVDLGLGELGPGGRLARRIADHRGEVTDDQHRDVPEVLEQAEPPEHDREAEVDVGGGGVDAELDPQRRAALAASCGAQRRR